MSSWFSQIKEKFQNKTGRIGNILRSMIKGNKIDEALLEELQESLLLADVGTNITDQIIDKLKSISLKDNQEEEQEKLYESVYDIMHKILDGNGSPLVLEHKPHIIMMCGVNGNGKTTVIGKLAHQYVQQGKKVAVAACDTFRAAAVQQLEIWAKRSGAHLVSSEEKADPASVAYKSVQYALDNDVDVLLIDTAGRLHNKTNLMSELNKITKVIGKLHSSAPHDVILVLDGTNGQNTHNQVEEFGKCVNVNGLIVTKLDGSAKGGTLLSLVDKFKLPIRAVGVGEAIDDLKDFDEKVYIQTLLK